MRKNKPMIPEGLCRSASPSPSGEGLGRGHKGVPKSKLKFESITNCQLPTSVVSTNHGPLPRRGKTILTSVKPVVQKKNMKNLPILLLLLLIHITAVHAQETLPGILRPGESFTNGTTEVYYCVPRQRVISLLESRERNRIDSIRIEKYKTLTGEYVLQISLADSALVTCEQKAKYLEMEMKLTDEKLREQEEYAVSLKLERDRARRSRLFYFFSGIAAASLVIMLTD